MRFLRSEEEREQHALLEAERARRDESPERRWEYTVLRLGPKARAEGPLNELGAKGWQLVQVVETDGHLAFYLEREVFFEEEADEVEPGSNGSSQGD